MSSRPLPEFQLLRRASLPLLLCFDSLMRTRSVTATARQLHKSQPAISRDLARLRTLMGDPLFVLVNKKMAPTERALQLHAPISDALANLESALGPAQPFSPAHLSGVVNIAAAAHIEVLLAAPLTQALQQAAPGLTIRFQPLHGEVSPDDLDAERMDLAIGLFQSLPDRIPRKLLFTDERVAVMSSRHPLAKRRNLALKDLAGIRWLALSHMHGKRTNFDLALQGTGYQMHFSAYVSSFGLAPFFLMESDYATTLPLSVAEKYRQHFELALLRLPPALRPAPVIMAWSLQADGAAMNQWLRATVSELIPTLIGRKIIPAAKP